MLKKLMGILLAVLMVLLLSLPALAEGADGLSIYLSADQAEYGKKDDITVTLTVKNTNPAGVSYADIRLLNEVPNGYILQAGSSAEKMIRLLKAGEEATLTSVFHPVHIPSTGDQGIGTPLLVGGIALFCLLFLLSVKKSRYMHLFRSMMCLLLVISMAAATLPITAMAASLTIPFSTVVKVEDKEVKLNSLVSYDPLKRVQEESLTIGDILPEDFPTTPDDGWRIDNDRNRVCYKAEDPDTGDKTLDFSFNVDGLMGTYSIPLSSEITEKEGKYEYYKEGCETIAFFISEGKLEQIYYESYDFIDDPAIGTYTPPIPPYEGPTIADILPSDFPSTDYWTSPPKNAWITENGSLCFREKDTKIDFYNEGYDDYGHLYQRVVQIYLSSPITKNEDDNYISGDILFVMSGEDIVQIEYNSSREPRGVFTPPQKIGEEALTIADILPDDFPTASDHAWRKDSYRACITDGTYLWFSDSINGTSLGLPVGDPVAESEGNYVYDKSTYMEEYEEYWGYKATFIMSEGKLASIEMIEYDFPDFTGTYVKPQEGKTLAEIIPADFPVTVGDFGELIPDNAWCTSDGKLSCKSAESFLFPETSLIFYADNQSMGIYFHEVATESEGNYILEDETGKITFVMTDGKLTSIEFADTGADARYNGIYMPPA